MRRNLKYYRKSRFSIQGYDVTSQNINKDQLVDYIVSNTNAMRNRLVKLTWKKLIGIFYLMNYKDAQKAWKTFNI